MYYIRSNLFWNILYIHWSAIIIAYNCHKLKNMPHLWQSSWLWQIAHRKFSGIQTLAAKPREVCGVDLLYNASSNWLTILDTSGWGTQMAAGFETQGPTDCGIEIKETWRVATGMRNRCTAKKGTHTHKQYGYMVLINNMIHYGGFLK